MSIYFDSARSGYFSPTRFEADLYDCEVEGKLPSDLNGTFYRIQPDRKYPQRFPNDIPFNGDGMATYFRFNNGHVDFKSRYVHTDRYVAEAKAREALFGLYRNRYSDDPSVKKLSGGTANTNLFYHAGKLLALKEDSPPIAVDPHTLETLGDWDFNGKLSSLTFTAHPKVDVQTGEMICFGYEAKGEASRDIAVYSVDKKGDIVWEAWVQAPYAGMLHDFGVSEKHVIFYVIPLVASVEQMKKNEVHFAWDNKLPTYLGVMRRGGDGSDVRWFKGPERCATHVMNAFDDGTKVHIDMPVSASLQFPFFPMLNGVKLNMQDTQTYLKRLSVDLASKNDTYEETQLTPYVCEMPRCDDRYMTHAYRYGFMYLRDPSRPFDNERAGNIGRAVNNCFVRLDHQTNKLNTYWVGDTSGVQEPCFIPRSNKAAEGEGYLIGVVARYAEMRSDLVVLDAQHMEEGPLATVKLPFRLPSGLHGNWVPSDIIPISGYSGY